MSYLDLRKAFHDPTKDENQLYDHRFNDERTWHLDTLVAGEPAFVYMAPEIYEALLEASQIDKDILRLETDLPQRALDSYRNSCLIDEIVLTNEIEGVHSTRREIGEILERLQQNDRHGRFLGIVQKYALLQSRPDIPFRTCADVREVYDDLVSEEIRTSDPKNLPDGMYFRTKAVHVVNESGIPIHDGLEPEEKIIREMERALALLNDESKESLARIALFHFLFGFIHPFYDGNGRTNRFISSYFISREYEPIVGLGISYAVKQEIEKYYKAFSLCEHPLNRGDITPFVIAFSEICVHAMRNLRKALTEKKSQLDLYLLRSESVIPDSLQSIVGLLITATLFTFDGITAKEICESEHISRQTLYKRMAELRKLNLVCEEKTGRKTFYKLNEEAFLSRVNKSALS